MRKNYEISAFAEKIGLPEEFIAAALPVCERILGEFYDDYAKINADRMNGYGYAKIAEKLNIDSDLSMLAVAILLGIDAHELYKSRGIDDRIYYDSMREITIWSKVCMREYGKIGIRGQHEWLNNFTSLYIVRLGRLEFQTGTFADGLTWEKHGLHVRSGDPVINMHIPEDGSMRHEDVLDAYRQAYKFFGCTSKAVFVCHTWLLYPGNRDFLPEQSNIRDFMDDFDIIKREDVKFSSDLWRVFGKRESYEPSSLPRDNSLRRNLAEYLSSHDCVTGCGYGVFAFDGEKVYN